MIGLALGYLFFHEKAPNTPHIHDHKSQSTTWTCSMHPQIRQPEAGDCPICGMDLIPVDADDADLENPLEIKMSPTALQLAHVQTEMVSKKKPIKEIRLNGKVQADERYIFSQTSHISGRIEQLLVTYTGEYIRKGQVIAYIYSPELVTAQEELFEAKKIKDQQPALFKAAKEKLQNWKLTDQQIEGILEAETPTEHFPILSDVSGVVTKKRVNLGDHIREGSPLFEVANLSQVWILFDVYERDLAWVNVGNEVDFIVPTVPGAHFTGKISFIDPVINPQTRVAKARIAFPNHAQRFKPEMLVQGTLQSPLKNGEPAIIIPKSAVMWTGKRSLVYVKTHTTTGMGFEMRDITLGPALGNQYLITEGLEEGEEIVVYGTFSVDAAAQLAGKPSMMTQPMHSKTFTINQQTQKELHAFLKAYFKLKDALVQDDVTQAQQAWKALQQADEAMQIHALSGEAHQALTTHQAIIHSLIHQLAPDASIENIRIKFNPLSDQVIQLAKSFNVANEVLFVQHCPMANSNRGAYWLSTEQEIRNPYFGAAMLTCGSIKEKIR